MRNEDQAPNEQKSDDCKPGGGRQHRERRNLVNVLRYELCICPIEARSIADCSQSLALRRDFCVFLGSGSVRLVSLNE